MVDICFLRWYLLRRRLLRRALRFLRLSAVQRQAQPRADQRRQGKGDDRTADDAAPQAVEGAHKAHHQHAHEQARQRPAPGALPRLSGAAARPDAAEQHRVEAHEKKLLRSEHNLCPLLD